MEFNTIPHKFWWVVHNSIKKEPIAGPIFITDYSTISLLKNKKSYHNLLFLFYLILKCNLSHALWIFINFKIFTGTLNLINFRD